MVIQPPEDVDGIHGYENFLEAMHDPQHPDHKEYPEWIGGPLDPEAFDLTAINRKLHRMK